MTFRRGLVALITVALTLGAANTSEIRRDADAPMPSASISSAPFARPAAPKIRRTLQKLTPPSATEQGERDLALGLLLLLTSERGNRR
ncbi:MAG TPA: hypothetical protein VGU22_03375 [Methylomirabilota bacterium]|jgi:hypothetical protein|nr:hypothetical protein [Methylomirabilota bacterium]